jgi:hypothetical protein
MTENTPAELSLKEVIDCVRAFHDSFGINNENAPIANINQDTIMLRYKLMREENAKPWIARQNGRSVS